MGKRRRIFFEAVRKMNARQILIYAVLFAWLIVCVIWSLHNFHVIP
jgi:hypothetical protein